MILNGSIFRIGMWNSRPPPPFMAKTLLNFHFDYLKPSLMSFSISLNYEGSIFLALLLLGYVSDLRQMLKWEKWTTEWEICQDITLVAQCSNWWGEGHSQRVKGTISPQPFPTFLFFEVAWTYLRVSEEIHLFAFFNRKGQLLHRH